MFKAEKSALLSALETARGAIERRNTIPVLANVLFEQADEEDRLSLRATDLDIQIDVSFAAEREASFAPFTAPALMLHSIVKSLPDGREITLSDPKPNGRAMQEIEVKSGRSKFRLPILPASDFPELPAMQGKAFSFPVAPLRQALSDAAFAVSGDEARHYLQGVFLHRRKKDFALIATDGHKLVRRIVDAGEVPADPPSVIIPTKTVNFLIGALPESGEVEIAIDDRRIAIAYGHTHISSKLVDGTFPDYERVIPNDLDREAVIERRALLDAAKRVGLVTATRSKAAVLTFAEGALTISLNDQESGGAMEDIDAECAFDERCGVNNTYLAESLSHMPGARVTVRMATPPHLIALTSAEGHDDDVIIIMMMRVRKRVQQ